MTLKDRGLLPFNQRIGHFYSLTGCIPAVYGRWEALIYVVGKHPVATFVSLKQQAQFLMKTVVLFLFTSIMLGTPATAQTRVANFETGAPGTDRYEHLSFWIKAGQRAEIYYSYGKNRTETRLTYRPATSSANGAGFGLQFPNRYVLYVGRTGNQLRLVDAKGTYRKTFTWAYEGPVNGIGTFCSVCAPDEQAAMQLMQQYYLK